MRAKTSVIGVSVVVALAATVGFTLFRPRTVQTPSDAASTPPLRLAPDIEVTMYQGQAEVGGEKIALSDLWEKKRQPVVLNFWAGLCPPCRAEMPDFQRLYEQPKRKFDLIGVDIGPFINLGSRNYEILGMPTTVFITTDGRIWRKHAGLLTFNQVKALADDFTRVSSSP